MQWDFIIATAINLSINLAYTLLALFIGVKALLIIDEKLLKDMSS